MAQIERIPPHNDDAEKSVLGAALIDSEAFIKISDIVKADDFYSNAHKEIYAAMIDLYQKGQPIDLVTVVEQLRARKALEAAGGRAYVAELSGFAPTSANATSYAKIVADKAVVRKLISTSSTIIENCFKENIESETLLDNAEAQMYDIAQKRQSSDFSSIQDVLKINVANIHEAEANGHKLPGLPTGYIDLDKMTSGLQKSDLIIIAARPSMGKTAFALNIAQHVAMKEKKRVAIFSLEMSKEQLGLRLLAMDARVDSKKLRVGDLSEDNWERVNDSIRNFVDADIVIDDTPGLGVMELRNKARRMDKERKLDLIMIDYLQMMSSDSNGESRQQEVTQISRYLKQLAREMQCPVVVLSQLSRAVEARQGDKRPILSDLRESGAIEQDADVVMFLYREDYYKRDQEPTNICEVIIAKQRMGETGIAKLAWLPSFTKFVNIQKGPEA
ncbi:MAG: replicative DNA helicase [Clostridia bacterium]|nr:replicative DNA helicase [Clostridia bacterium]